VNVAAIVLAAGAATRFGAPKLLVPVAGRPVLARVLDAVREAGIEDLTVVLPPAAESIVAALPNRGERLVTNPDPSRGLASSLKIGVESILARSRPDGILVVLGDQPVVDPLAIRAMCTAEPAGRALVVPRYEGDGARNPVLVLPAAYPLVDDTSGDRGLGPIMDAHPELVLEVPLPGTSPDLDRPSDLLAVLEAAWAERVRRNGEQVDRHREVPDGTDFYAPVRSTFRADPFRTGDDIVEALLALARPGERWLDIGAGAGRYALPLARVGGTVVALDPSPSMLEALREGAAEAGLDNVRTIEGRWPLDPADADGAAALEALGPFPCAGVALIAHVSYDITPIGPFLDAMEAAAARRCVAVLFERPAAATAEPFWPVVHGEARVPLPALPEFLELLEARGARPSVRTFPREERRFASVDELTGYLRRQLWVAPGGAKDERMLAHLRAVADVAADGTVRLPDEPRSMIGVVAWVPLRGGRAAG
jgi:molybdenum cofactor cytidylyltransferase